MQNGSSPQWIIVGAPSRAAARMRRSELSSAGCAIVVTGCSLRPDEAQLADRAHEQPLGLVAVPRVDARVGLEAPRPARAHVRDHLERGRVDLGRVGDRHDHGGLHARRVELLDRELRRHVPAERRHVVDVEVGIDDRLGHAPSVAGRGRR